MTPQGFVLLIIAVVFFVVGGWLGIRHDVFSPTQIEAGYVLDTPRALPEFVLKDSSGNDFSQKDFQGHWSLLYFGFTYCPDICPTAMAVMAQANDSLSSNTETDLRFYLVSVDPDRDTPERLDEYVRYFDPGFIGLTGEFTQLDILTQAAGAVYQVPETAANEEYLVAHSSTLTLINPRGEIHAIFTEPFEAQVIASDLEQISR